MTRPIRWLALSLALAYGGLTTTSAFAQFEGLDLGASKKKKGGTTTTKGKKGKKGKKEEEQVNLPPPPETGTPPTTSPAAGAAGTAKPTDNGKPGDTGGLGLDLSSPGDSGPAAKTPPKKGDKTAPTMSFEAVDVSGKTADRQKLDAALNEFKDENYEKAALSAWELTQDPKLVELHPEAQYLLAKSLYRLKLYHSSLGVFSKLLAKGPDGKFFKTSLEWLFFISHKTVNESVVLDEIAKYSNFEFPEKFRSEFHYLLARYHFVRGRALDLAERKAEADQSFTEVKRIVLQVPKEDPFYPRTRYLEALALFRDDNFTAALEALKDVVRVTRSAPKGEEPGLAAINKKLREEAFMQLARTHYGHKQNRYAIFYYSKVERGGPEWLESLFEAAWGHYRIGQYEQALGNLITLSSPFFREEYFPEALVLKAVIYYENCRYKESTMILEDFERIYLPVHDQLEQITAREVDASEYYNVLAEAQRKNKENRARASADLILERILKLALTDQDLKKTNDSILELEQELDAYGQRADTFKYSDFSKQMLETLKGQRVELVKKAGIMAKGKLEFELGELKKLLANGLRIRFETTSKEKEFLEAMLQAGGQTATLKAYKDKVAVADDELYWPYEGEYWRDELGTYRYTLTKGCISRDSANTSPELLERVRRVAMARPITIAFDVMGSDHGPAEVVKGATRLTLESPGLHALLVGDAEAIREALEEIRHSGERVSVHHAPQFITMDEKPSEALQRKPDASVAVAARLVRDGEADAVVSAGNTGAGVLACARHFQLIPGVRRAALAAVYPTQQEHGEKHDPFSLILDVGATVDATSDDLVAFAVMGAQYSKVISKNPNPKVALLSNGVEPGKGPPRVVEAHQKLAVLPGIRFTGNVEGLDIPKGRADVIVTDGFVGNVCLKMLEGVAETVVDLARYAYKSKLRWRAGLAMLSSGIKRLKSVTDWEQYGGAPVLGFDQLFIKAHGRSKSKAIANAGKVAAKAVSSNLAAAIREGLPH